ncbi:histidine ammonia-lyase [Candidatus Thorarchaeota archaeon]|nr:MAG: histidine ammonia-lyase [Candidatus Thorarchaeota archaeon]
MYCTDRVKVLVIEIDGESLSIEDIIEVARNHAKVRLADSARVKMDKSREVIESAVEDGRVVYGVNTGFGNLANVSIDGTELEKLQVNLIRSHSVGIGDPFSLEIVRGMMLLRANALAKGYSGVRIELVETLVQMLNEHVTPVVPEKGSVGASGDLAPLAHMALVIIGEGEAFYGGERFDGKTAMKKAGIKTLTLRAKEGVALINGTQAMTSVGALLVHDALALIRDALVASAMSLEALRGTRAAFDKRIHELRPHEGQLDVAEALMRILPDSEINQSHADCGKVQDAYTLRCIPQVIGASLDTVRYVRSILETELNSVTDNPLVFPDERDVVSGGNFHGQPIALAMDFLGIALSEIANISERRTNRLVNANLSGLPPFLAAESGLQSGMMLAQYTAAALVSENKILSHPASVDSIPTSADQEDHVSMGTIAARKAREILENVRNVIAIEYLCAAEGIDLLTPLKAANPLISAKQVIRSQVAKMEDDRALSNDIAKICNLQLSGKMIQEVERETGSIIPE